MISKKEILARFCDALGIHRLLGRSGGRPVLLVLNYHRINEPATCPYDRDVISSTPEAFYEQVSFLKGAFPVADLEEVEAIATRPARLDSTKVVITFDDGYRDNFDLAFPVLKAHGVPAVFFLPTSYIGTAFIPWWDQMAWMIRRYRGAEFRMTYPKEVRYNLAGADVDGVIREVLRRFASPEVADPERFIVELEEATGVDRPASASDPVFLDWGQVAEMAGGGMDVASHTHSHAILGKMGKERQRWELQESRDILERHLGSAPRSLAFPVGTRDSFNGDTREALEETGYKAAFSYYGGVNTPGIFDRFNILRTAVESDTSLPLLKLRGAMAAWTGKHFV